MIFGICLFVGVVLGFSVLICAAHIPVLRELTGAAPLESEPYTDRYASLAPFFGDYADDPVANAEHANGVTEITRGGTR